MGQSLIDANYQGDICPGNICPGDISPYQHFDPKCFLDQQFFGPNIFFRLKIFVQAIYVLGTVVHISNLTQNIFDPQFFPDKKLFSDPISFLDTKNVC